MASLTIRHRGVHPFNAPPTASFVSSTRGNDSTGTGSYDSPWASIGTAVTNQASWVNNTLYIIGDGTVYSTYFGGSINVLTSGSSGSPKRIRGFSTGTRPILRPSTFDGNESLVFVAGDYIEFYDLEIDGTLIPNHGNGVTLSTGCSHVLLDHVYVHDVSRGGDTGGFTGAAIMINSVEGQNRLTRCTVSSNGRATNFDHGIYFGEGPGTVVDNCEVDHTKAYGIHGYNGGGSSQALDDCVVRQCHVHDNGAQGILMGGGRNIQVINNLVVNNAGSGITGEFTARAADMLVAHNAVYGWGNKGMVFDGNNSSLRLYNNIVWDGTDGSTASLVNTAATSSVVGNHLSTANPQWVDPDNDDFRLSSNSTCINLGTDIGVLTDYVGNGRVGDPDAGAYEFQG